MAQRPGTVELYGELIRDIGAGRLLPIYFLAGEERLLSDRVVTALRRAALEGAVAELNHDQVSAGERKMGDILQLARTVPMMGPRRLVEVRDAEALGAPELEKLLPYVEAPVGSTVLLFVASKADARLRAFKALDREGYLFRFEPVRGAPLIRFMDSEAKRLGARLGGGVAELLVELVGPDFLALSSAVEKLCLYVGEGGQVTLDHVDSIVAQTRQAVIFELTDAVGEGNVSLALRSLASLRQAGEPEQRVVFMIARQVRMIWRALEALAAGTPAGNLGQVLGVPPFVAQKVAAQARRFDLPTIEAAHQQIHQADKDLKSLRLPRHLVLERLVLGLCLVRGARQPRGQKRAAGANRGG
ncbi:MAG: DNA polymerase III subunit delta [Polyangia bacterium]|jgi:DNA polymerase-3 subunit delta|nr:DNA polymerase III subunit delta [Polyangia bacterium]